MSANRRYTEKLSSSGNKNRSILGDEPLKTLTGKTPAHSFTGIVVTPKQDGANNSPTLVSDLRRQIEDL